MSRYVSKKLRGQILVKHGFPFKSEFFKEVGGYVVLTPGNFHEEGGFKRNAEKDKCYSHSFPEEYLLEQGDIIVAMTEQSEGLLGSMAKVPENNKFLHNQRLGLVTTQDSGVLLDFIYHLFKTNYVRRQIQLTSTGSKVKHTAPKRIYDLSVLLPSFDEQTRISNLLSSLDAKIELNNRINAELEAMAKTLYDYWFVQFDFPDANHRPYKSSGGKMVYNKTLKREIPVGWKAGILNDVVSIKRGKTITKKDVGKGKIPVVAGGLTPAYFHDKSNAIAPTITISASGANAGFVNFYLEDIWASDCSVVSASTEKYICYRYLEIKRNQSRIYGMQLGSAQPHVYPKDIAKIVTVYPTEETVKHFEKCIRSKYNAIALRRKENQHLTELRDWLLPMLMNGQVRVG